MSEENDKALIVKTPVSTNTDTGLFKGPLGLWPWPVMNLVLSIITKLSGKNGSVEPARASHTKVTELRPTAEGGWSILEHEV